MNNINILEVNKIFNENNCAFLCGNGFSINFDETFKNIFDRLYIAHKSLIYNSKYTSDGNIYFKRKCIDNYKNVLQNIRNFNKDSFYKIFSAGLEFAESILKNEKLINLLIEKQLICKLKFDRSELDILNELYEKGISNGVNSINIEYWTILTYFYFAINYIKPKNYIIPNNIFTRLVSIGDANKTTFIKDESILRNKVIESTVFNGFNNYYRMLFSITIFSEGKHLELNKLDKIDKLSLEKLKCFFNNFDTIFTLNYDLLLEKIVPDKDINHLHGKFVLNEKEYVYNQSLSLNYENDKNVSFSNILIGDYFSKHTRVMLNKFSQKNGMIKKI